MGEKFIINISGNNYEVVACCEAEALRTLAKQLEDAYEPIIETHFKEDIS